MSKIIKLTLASLLICLSLQQLAFAIDAQLTPATPTSYDQVIIDGVTNFLADRAQANAEYIFEIELKDNIDLSGNNSLTCYLPNTTQTLKNIHLVDLLKTNSQIWRKNLATDIKTTSIFLLFNKLNDSDLSTANAQALGKLISSRPELTNRIPEIKEDISSLLTDLNDAKNTRGSCLVDSAKKAIIKTFLGTLNTSIVKADPEPKSLNIDALGILPKLLALYDAVKVAKDSKNDLPITTVANYSTAIVDLINLASTDALNKDENFAKVKSYLLFFVSLADAKTSNQVTLIMQNFMLQPVSFGEIRNNFHISISSYVGLYSSITTPNHYEDAGTAIYAPIGVQVSWPIGWIDCCMQSLGIMISPVDFGYPLSMKFKGSDNTATWNDVLNPSISIAFGAKKLPVNWGLAFQHVNQNIYNPNPGTRAMFFLSLDMPLYILR